MFPIYKYTVNYRFQEKAVLPRYKGSIIRGLFGMHLRKTVCVNPKLSSCRTCVVGAKCAYCRMFEPTRQQGGDVIDLPHPFVLEPPEDNRTEYQTGDDFAFGLLLFGEAVEEFPYALVAFKGMEKIPIGFQGKRGAVVLSKITAFDKTIYDSAADRLEEYRVPCPAGWGPAPSGGATVNLVTPMRIMLDKRLQKRLTFKGFFKTLIRRISSLRYYYSREKMDPDEVRRLIEMSEDIKTVEDKTFWQDWKRYSAKQKEEMNLGGLVGAIRYRGDLEPFWPYLKLGELVHVGKNTSFGLGRYEIIQ